MSHKKVSSSLLLVLMSWAALAVPASAQHFEQVKSTGNLASVSAGRNEVFALESNGGAVWRYNPSTQSFGRIPGTLTQVAVGGGTLSQLDEVWGLSGSEVYRFNYTTKVFDHIAAPTFTQIIVGEGAAQSVPPASVNPTSCYPYEVWGLGPVSGGPNQIARYNFCENTFESYFTGNIIQVATGGGDVWGLQRAADPLAADPFHFLDSQGELNFLFSSGRPLTQIVVGVNDVWGINSNVASAFEGIYRYDPNTNGFVNLAGTLPPGETLKQMAAGGDGVWGLDPIGHIWRWDPSSESFVQVDGVLTSIAVGSGAGVWGVNSSGQVFTFVRP